MSFSFLKTANEVTATAAGMFLSSAPIHSLLLDAAPSWISQGAMDEIAKGIAGLAVAVLSRVIFGWIDRKRESRRRRKRRSGMARVQPTPAEPLLTPPSLVKKPQD